MQRHTFINGGLVGVLFTAPLIAILYLADQAAGLPFVPYDLFDWLARNLPADIVDRGISTMVTLINDFNLGATDSTAKTLENIMGIATVFGIGVAGAVVLFAVLARRSDRPEGLARWLPGVALAAVVGVPLMLTSHVILYSGSEEFTDVPPEWGSILWLGAIFLAWGVAITWAYDRLSPVGTPAPPAEMPSSRPAIQARQISRRDFLIRVGGATATLTVIGAGIGRYLQYRDKQEYKELIRDRREAAASMPDTLPNADDPVMPAPGTRPEYTPLEDHYQIDINSRPLEINESEWRLRITGMVDNPLALALDDIRENYDPLHQYVTLACISNPIGGDLVSTTRWTGASLQAVLADAGVQSGATHLRITSADGFYETVALDLITADDRIMLAYNWDGIPLLYKHGFPLRIYIPDLYGMKQPKWITGIEAMDHDEDGYWVVRGWDKVARMRATSVVDVVAEDRTFTDAQGRTLVPVGGIARAGARGISKVEVKVDDGEWTEARLRSPLSETTWVIWRYDWPFEAGEHRFAVRCYDGDGNLQITEQNSTKPSGATGVHRVTRGV
jgi:DMSO/TMAO reductase YedYZ molybdopterin-dependent catalytic subunit